MMASIVAWECERRPLTTRGAAQRAAVSTSKMRSSQMKAAQFPRAGRKITPSVTISGGLRKAGEKEAAASRVWGSWDSKTMGGLLGRRSGIWVALYPACRPAGAKGRPDRALRQAQGGRLVVVRQEVEAQGPGA